MIPDGLKNREQWLVWRLEQKPGAAKPAKMPYYASGQRAGERRTGKQGDPSDRACLTTLEHAMKVKSLGFPDGRKLDGIGFAFLEGDGLIGIDLDKGVFEESIGEGGEILYGDLTPWARGVVESCASFTERSPSGRGVHIYAFGATSTFKSNEIGVEVFCGSQFFTVTGEHVDGTPPRVNAISPPALAGLRAMVDEAKARAPSPGAPAAATSSQPAPGLSTRATTPSPDDDFARVNAAAMQSFGRWVPALFPAAKVHGQGYRITSKSLGRDLQEDIAIHPDGIRDFGEEKGCSPIDLVMAWSQHREPKEALHHLAGLLGVDIAKPGSRGFSAKREGGEGGAEQGAPAAGGDGGGDDGSLFDGEYSPQGEPLIDVRAGFLHEAVDQAEAVLIDRAVKIFERGGMLARVIRKPVVDIKKFKRPESVLGIVPVELPYLVELFSRAAHWRRWDPKKKDAGGKFGDWKRIDAPDKAAAAYMARAGHRRLRQLWSVISAPTLRPDGSVLQTAGYDEAMKAWYDPCGVQFPVIPEEPTKAEARAALDELMKAFSTLPFVDDVDTSVAVSLAMSTLVRRSLESAPLGAISASSPSTGKTLLVDACAILATGSRAPALTFSENEEEFKKTLLAVLIEGDQLLLIDNVSAPLKSDTLCSVLTSATLRQRMLGRTEMVNAPTTTQMFANGNQLVIQGDLRWRTLLCRLDAKCERPQERVFAVELKDLFLRDRTRLVAAALTVMRAYQVFKRSPEFKSPIKPLGRFEQWSEMVRAPLVWLGEADPCNSMAQLEKEDPEREDLVTVLAAWHQLYRRRDMRATEVCNDLVNAVTEDEKRLAEALKDGVRDRDGLWRSKRLGYWLRKRAGRHAGGYVLLKSEQEKDHSSLWRVETVSE